MSRKERKVGDTELALTRRLKEHGRKPKTIDAYCKWYLRYMRYLHGVYGKWVNPREVREPDFEEFLTALACDSTVAPATQNQAFYAICYLYRYVLESPLENVSALRAKGNTTVRTILDQPEIELLLSRLTGVALSPLAKCAPILK